MLSLPAGKAILGGGTRYYQRVLTTQRASLIAYWPLWETSGSVANDLSGNARHGAYTGVDLGQPGIGDGRTSPLFDAVNDYANVFSTSLRDAWSGSELTIATWVRMSAAGVWADGANRFLYEFNTDSNNRIALAKISTANTVQTLYRAGGVSKTVNKTTSTTSWMFFAMTASLSNDAMKVYYADAATPLAQVGATQTGLGTWAGTLTTALLGAQTTVPGNPHSGLEAHTGIWSTALAVADLTRLAVV